MNKTLVFLIIVSQFFVSLLFAQQDRGMRVVTKDLETGTELGIYANLWAVVVGVNKYQQWPRLNYAVRDAEAVAELLKTKYGIQQDHIILIRYEQATLQAIKDALSELIVKTGKDDGVVFFFAGHGQTFRTLEGKEMGYMIPVDGRKEEAKLYTTALPMSEVKNLCNLIPAKHILFLVDACYSGLAAAADYRGTLTSETRGFLHKVTRAKTRHVITAGSAGEQVQEREEWGHSAFTYELLNALERDQADYDYDGIVTADELAEYLTSRVSRITNNAQLPQSKRLSVDEGKFVFVQVQHGTEKISDIKIEETERNNEKKKEDIVSPQTKEIVIEPELRSLRGFYLFYGIGYGHAQGVGNGDIDRGSTFIFSLGPLLPAFGYKFNESFALQTRVVVSARNSGYGDYQPFVASWLVEGKYFLSATKTSSYIQVGIGLGDYYDSYPLSLSQAFGIDMLLSEHFSLGVEALFIQVNKPDDGVRWFAGGNLLVRYQF